MSGMLVDPSSTERNHRVKLRNQVVLSRVQLRSGEGDQWPATYTQGGLITNRRTVQSMANHHLTHAPLWYQKNQATTAEGPATPLQAPEVPQVPQEPEAPEAEITGRFLQMQPPR